MKEGRQHCPCFKHFLTFISLVSLGKNNFSRLDPEVLNKKVVLVMDNDGALISSGKIFIYYKLPWNSQKKCPLCPSSCRWLSGQVWHELCACSLLRGFDLDRDFVCVPVSSGINTLIVVLFLYNWTGQDNESSFNVSIVFLGFDRVILPD